VTTFYSKLLTGMQQRMTASVPAEPAADHLRDLFALQVQAVLHAVGLRSEYDADQFSLRMDLGNVSRLANLENQFYEFEQAAAEERDGIVLHVANGIRDACRPSPIAEELTDARAALRPRIRHRAHLVIVRLQRESQADDPDGVYVPVSTDLGAEIVYDTPTNIVSLPADQLAVWGLTPEEALEIAVRNLRAAAPDPFRAVGDGVYVATVGDCFDSARLLLTDQIAALPLNGPPVALPANRDTLMITGANDLGGLYRLLEVALQALERPRMDTLHPVVLSHGAWREWLPPEGHPMWEAFYELSVLTRGECYAAMRRALDDQHQRQGLDVFVASFGVMVRSAGELPWSHAVWPPVAGWLPEADLVTVINPGGDRYIVVPWPKLRQVAHHRMRKVPEMHPPYFAFDGAPDDELWERLRVHAVREGVVSQRARAAAAR
jgi:hypothetical protein